MPANACKWLFPNETLKEKVKVERSWNNQREQKEQRGCPGCRSGHQCTRNPLSDLDLETVLRAQARQCNLFSTYSRAYQQAIYKLQLSRYIRHGLSYRKWREANNATRLSAIA